jgi:hypothetical protein
MRGPLTALALGALLLPATLPVQARTSHHPTALIARDGVILRASPSAHGHALATLVQQTQVEVLQTGTTWDHVRVWASASGWVARKDLTFRRPWPSVSTYHAPVIHNPITATKPAAISTWATVTSTTAVANLPGKTPLRRLPAGASVHITAWQQDRTGQIWYAVPGGWAPGDTLRFARTRSTVRSGQNGPIWAPVAGKGMWLTLGTIAGSDPAFLAEAARRDGITHLYLEAAISPLGFHGRLAVGPLIDAAHRAGLRVIAWVFPYLQDIAADVALTRRVAAFRTGSGQRFDGIAADLETNVTLAGVRAYSQLTRLYLGPSYLLVGVTYPPQSSPSYPFAEVAPRYDVLAPMDYWHETQTRFGLDYGHMAYGEEYGRRYALDSIDGIRRLAPGALVAPIGQTFDDFGRLEMGPNAPSAAEIRGFLDGAKEGGAIGVSFFQWMTATRGEFQTIHDYKY